MNTSFLAAADWGLENTSSTVLLCQFSGIDNGYMGTDLLYHSHLMSDDHDGDAVLFVDVL